MRYIAEISNKKGNKNISIEEIKSAIIEPIMVENGIKTISNI